MIAYREKISKARLILMQNELRFFGIRFLNCDVAFFSTPDLLDDDGNLIMRVYAYTLSPKYTNGKWIIMINEETLKLDSYTPHNLAFVICHELTHILHYHSERMSSFEIKPLADAAREHVTDLFLKYSITLKPHENGYSIIQDAEKELGRDATVGEVYKWLLDRICQNRTKIVPLSGVDGDGNEIPLPLELVILYDHNGNRVHSYLSERNTIHQDDAEAYRNESTALVNTLNQQNKLAGKNSGNILLKLTELLRVEIPPEKILEKAIRNSTLKLSETRRWINPNKKYAQYNILLPGPTLEDSENVNKLIVTLDTSGSMSKKTLERCCNVIAMCFDLFREVYLIVHDYHVHQVETFADKNVFINYLKSVGLKGRGGTSHIDAFNKTLEIINKNEDQVSLIISLTDAYSDLDMPECLDVLYKKLNIPIVFISEKSSCNMIALDVIKNSRPSMISYILF